MLLLSTSTPATVYNIINRLRCELLSFNRRRCSNDVDRLCVLEGRVPEFDAFATAQHASANRCDTPLPCCEKRLRMSADGSTCICTQIAGHVQHAFSLRNETNQLICIEQSINHITKTDESINQSVFNRGEIKCLFF